MSFSTEHDIKDICKDVFGMGVAKVLIEYNGSGDDGSVNDIDFLDENGNDVSAKVLNVDYLKQKLNDEAYNILARQDFDWVNNDGGYGVIKIDTKMCHACIKHNQRVMEEHYEEYSEDL